ncbi:MAG: ABC transporter ATP-binding protein [Candidatus Eremiobacteraeota bacterium]|nr:ABC transporter ATP-binding protein [Candidatus Eremiobacteraeota bacterium]
MAQLEISGITKSFGKLTAVRDVSLSIERGTISAIIGPNGAGKSTLFNSITGIYAPDAGSIAFQGALINGWPSFRIAAAGIARTFQNIRLFSFMSAIDNVLVGEHARLRARIWDSLLHTPMQKREEREARRRAQDLLAFVGLENLTESYARTLPYGSQRRLEIARALASAPSLLLLDEPAAGMNPKEKQGLVELIRAIRDRGITVVLIEHDMGLVMEVSERITVLDHGERIAQGSPSEVRANPRVIEAYLGTPAA